jgi:flagellin
MGLQINTNVAAMNAYRNLSITDSQMGKSLEKLSSGFRINRAADDAAEGLRAQIGGLKIGVRNAQDGVSVAQTAEGALTEVHSMLQRMNDLAVQYNNGTQNTDSKTALSAEFTQLGTEIGRIQANTKFNGNALFNDTKKTFQVGYDSADAIDISATAAGKFTTTAAGATFAAGDSIGGQALDITASDVSDKVQLAINKISAQRAELGAIQNRFEHTVNNVNVAIENLSASESRIRDTDMAKEMTAFTRTQILSQAGTAMLAQANQAPQGVLSLLR